MNNNADVEVFVLVYNDGKIATKAIESVLAQTYSNVRLTILENGSDDDTRSVIEKYASDKRVKIVWNERNMRSGLVTPYTLKSDAEWISVLFADDYYSETRIAEMIEQAGDNAAVFSNNLYVDEEGKPTDPPRYISSVNDISIYTIDEHLRRFYILGNSLHPCAMMIRSQVYKELGGFPTYLHRLGDMYLFTKLLANYPVKLIPQRLQYITIWKDKRNESALNVVNPMPTALESCNFVDLYIMAPLFNRMERIFASHLENIELNTEAERFWYLGNITLRYCGVFRREFAFRCLYKAIELDEPRISKMIQNACGVSAGVYVGLLTEMHWPYQAPADPVEPPPVIPSTITFRQYLRQFKGPFVWVIRRLKRELKSWPILKEKA